MADIYATSLGVNLEITLNYDLTSNTGVTYRVKKPNNTFVNWTGTVDTAATGITHYTTVTGDLDLSGKYWVQVKVTFAGKIYYADPVTFEVTDVVF